MIERLVHVSMNILFDLADTLEMRLLDLGFSHAYKLI